MSSNLDVKVLLRNHEHTTILTPRQILIYRSNKGNMVMQFNDLDKKDQIAIKAFLELVVCHGLDLVTWTDNDKGLPFEEKRITFKP